ncbi:regulatory protein RecX [Parasphaerochaeta coccoides]|uniref:Regulatory protein RecX n=1 Tax=Parasphaerochaeta coccoides (strain ATCC BAA-1237 / DSM 17374 / SPN1) TaxID=760011 RepID=F4GL63_PARC1|nr:regulatory protein RecX [Parasphaerochaeta coccoides]AEC02403.1 Regulatory protein recX [Parasphaerochaeta coccoides DSM 17374]
MSARLERESSRDGYMVITEEGSPFFIPTSVAITLHLHDGDSLTDEQTALCLHASRIHACRQKALTLLAMRDHAPRELALKLCRKGWMREEADEVIARLREEHLVDEERYARSFVESRRRRSPEAPGHLELRLKEKGIGRDVIQAVVSEAFSSEESMTDAINDAIRKAPRAATGHKLMAYLRRKGFPLSSIRRVIGSIDAFM